MKFINSKQSRQAFEVIIFFASVHPLSTQQVSYPLHTGDEWQYAKIIPNAPWRVSSDTLMPNGKTYRIIASQGYPVGNPKFFWQYHRQEGNKVFAFNSSSEQEFLLFDFYANVGDTISTYPNYSSVGLVIVRVKNVDTIFGGSRRHWEFYHDVVAASADDEIRLEVTDTLGITLFSNAEGPGGFISGARINGNSYGTITSSISESPSVITKFHLAPAFPNPFNPSTTISYEVPSRSDVKLVIYNVLGQEVATVVDEQKQAGRYSLEWNASNVPSGVYFYRLQAGSFVETKKLVLIR